MWGGEGGISLVSRVAAAEHGLRCFAVVAQLKKQQTFAAAPTA